MLTKVGTEDEVRDFENALIAFSLYVLSDNYLIFMETVQKSLTPANPERILLFNLFDLHIYK